MVSTGWTYECIFNWMVDQLSEWKALYHFYNVQWIKKSFQATTPLQPTVLYEKEGLPKNFCVQNSFRLWSAMQDDDRNGEGFSVDIVSSVYCLLRQGGASIGILWP
jgi:hypothetical protein